MNWFRTSGFALFALATIAARGEPLMTDVFEAKAFEVDRRGVLLYRLALPKLDEVSERLPLVVFLHGAGQRGNDNLSQLEHGAEEIYRFTLETDNPAVILAAQVPIEEQWVNTPWGDDSHIQPVEPSRTMGLLMDLIQSILEAYPIDVSRIYVTGLSMGGFGTWDIIARMPDTFAAAIPICGGGDPATAPNIARLPIWVFHGSEDPVVQPRRSRDMVAALRASGGDPVYTEYIGVDHDAWTKTYSDNTVLSWLFSQRK